MHVRIDHKDIVEVKHLKRKGDARELSLINLQINYFLNCFFEVKITDVLSKLSIS